MTDLAPITSDADLVRDWNSGRAPRTAIEYAGDLRRIATWRGSPSVAAFLGELLGGGAGNANRIIISYKNSMLDKGQKPATVNRRLASIRSLVKFAQLVGRIEWSLAVRGVKRESPRPKAVAWGDFLKMVETETHPRTRACLALLGFAGLRINEVVTLDLADFDAETNTLTPLRKGRRMREPITLAPVVTQHIRDWIAVRGDAPGSLFGFASPSWLRRLVAAAGVRAGVPGVKPHGLRRATGTRVARITQNPYAVKAMSGHSDLQTAVSYVEEAADLQGTTARLIAEGS